MAFPSGIGTSAVREQAQRRRRRLRRVKRGFKGLRGKRVVGSQGWLPWELGNKRGKRVTTT
jgi:hypothetical protein